MTAFLTLRPRDPVVVRDGRPFGASSGRRMKALPWPPPSVLAGTVRTAIGRLRGGNFDPQLVATLKEVAVAGPFPTDGTQLYLPAPLDAVVRGGKAWAGRPEEGGGTDLPAGLCPVLPPHDTPDGKNEPPPAWWRTDALADWLASPNPTVESFSKPQFLPAPGVEERTHLKIDPCTLGANDGDLFSTEGLALDLFPNVSDGAGRLTARVCAGSDFAADVAKLSGLYPFGGERRLTAIDPDPTPPAWDCPDTVRTALADARRVRLLLATPAMFTPGWRPGWLTEDNGRVGTAPETGVKLRLVGAANDRPQAVSGWDYTTNKPKAVRRLVPAGAVYFFEVVEGAAGALAERWLESVSDDRADRIDGFGLAAWGVW